MLAVGDTVVTMSYPGLFVVVALDGDDVTIRDEADKQRIVRRANVRRLRQTEPTASS